MNALTKQHRIAETAKRWPNEPLTSLNHYLDLDWLREAYRRVRKDSAPGHDGQTVKEYGERLDENLAGLLERAKSGRYVAPPVRRVHIPKGTGKETRPIGIPTTEDKVLQRAVTMLIEPIYEAQFLDFSFGFRPGRSAHQALDYLWHQTMSQGTKWIIDLDIRKCFDTLSHGVLRQLLQQRVRDGVINRLVGKWLKAGVLEAGRLQYPEQGTPQGGVISPLLSNIYLHEVLDKWFVGDVLPRLHGRAFMVRYADDAVLGFESKVDAERVLRVLPKRFEKYGLQLHPEKTRLLPFGRPPRHGPPYVEPGTFNFLGFTHYWGRGLNGNWVLKRGTAKDRFSRALKAIRAACRQMCHWPLAEQHRVLSLKVKGHYAYYGITGNGAALTRFRDEVKWAWQYWLNRRSGQHAMPWEKFNSVVNRLYVLPPARVVHSALAAKP